MKKAHYKQLDSAISISEKGKIITLFYHSIISIAYDCPYIRLNTNKKVSYLVSLTLQDSISFLPFYFEQINKSTLVNLLYTELITSDKGRYVLKCAHSEYLISRRRYKKVLEHYGLIMNVLSKGDLCNVCKSYR